MNQEELFYLFIMMLLKKIYYKKMIKLQMKVLKYKIISNCDY